MRNATETSSDSLFSTTPPVAHRSKSSRGHHHHHVASRTGLHTRVPSSKALHKLNKAYNQEVQAQKAQRRAPSPTATPPISPMKPAVPEEKLSRNGSTTSLHKDSAQGQIRRNRSSAEVRRPKNAAMAKRSLSQPRIGNKAAIKTSVHFDLGNEGEDGWTEASASASPSISRSGSIGAQSSARSPAKPHSSAGDSKGPSLDGSPSRIQSKPDHTAAPDALQITSRLLQRTSSHHAPPQMSSISVTATPTTPSITSPNPENYQRSNSNLSGSRSTQDMAASRFLGSNTGTPQDPSYIPSRTSDPKLDRDAEAGRRVKSMANMALKDSNTEVDSDEERILAPRSRKPSTHAYNPPQQSRTQQKLWLQRASSNIEPQQLAPSATAMGINGFTGLIAGMNSSPLVGAGYDGKDPRVRLQLERTGMEYLVVRRYQDPIGRALRRLERLPGNEKMRRIPLRPRTPATEVTGGGRGRYGLSQSLKEGQQDRDAPAAPAKLAEKTGMVNASGRRSSYEGHASVNGSVGSERSTVVDADVDGTSGDGGVTAILRALWEKNCEMCPSVE